MNDPTSENVRLAMVALGVPILVEFRGPGASELSDVANRAWSRCLASASPASPIVLTVRLDPSEQSIHRDENTLVGSDPSGLLEHLAQLVTMTAITQQAGRTLLLHAAGLAQPDSGRTLALVGASGTGKTTAARSLGATLGYVTDETVSVAADLRVSLFPKPLGVIRSAEQFKSQVGPDEAGLASAPAQCMLHRIVLLDRNGASKAWSEPLRTLDAMAAIAPHTSYLSRHDRPLHRLGDTLDATGGAVTVHYKDAAQLAPLLAEILDS